MPLFRRRRSVPGDEDGGGRPAEPAARSGARHPDPPVGGARGGRRSSEELREAEEHLSRFARSHPGVEAFVEPRTVVTDTTVVFVAASGEWTRRRVAGPQAAHALARALGLPAYDAGVVGYPARMREWTRRRAEEDRRRREGGG